MFRVNNALRMLEKRIEHTNAHAQYKLPMDLLLFDFDERSLGGIDRSLRCTKSKEVEKKTIKWNWFINTCVAFSANISAVCFEKRAKKIIHCKNSVYKKWANKKRLMQLRSKWIVAPTHTDTFSHTRTGPIRDLLNIICRSGPWAACPLLLMTANQRFW